MQCRRGHQNFQENQKGASKILSDICKCLPHPSHGPVRSGGQVGLKPPNKFENNGAPSQALITCIVFCCIENSCPPPQSAAASYGPAFPTRINDRLKAHCRGCYWLVVMLKSKTKLSPSINYQAFSLLDHALFRE